MGNISGITGEWGGAFWKDFPGTERICVGVVECRQGIEGSVDVDGAILGRVGGGGFGLAGLSGRDDWVEGGNVDDNI